MAVTRSGQLYLIAALLLVLVAGSFAFLQQQSTVSAPDPQRVKSLFDRAQAELPRAVNTALTEEPTPAHVERRVTAFLRFQRYVFAEHAATDRQHALVVVPHDSGNLTAILVNYRRTALDTVNLTIDGTTRTLDRLPAGRPATFTYEPSTTQATAQLNFTARRTFHQDLPVTTGQTALLYTLRVTAPDQVWTETVTR